MNNVYDGFVLNYYLDQEIFDKIKKLIKKNDLIIDGKVYKKNNKRLLPIGLFSNKNFELKCKWLKTKRKFNIKIKKKIKCNFELKQVQKKIVEKINYEIEEITNINKAPAYITLVADCSIGKTVIAIHYIIKKKLKTIIITHNKELSKQWEKRIIDFTNLSVFNSMKGVLKFFDFYKNEDVIIIPSRHLENTDFCKFLIENFSFLIVDEQHVFNLEEKNNISDFMLNSSFNFVLSLTATPRLYNCLYFGRIIDVEDVVKNHKIKNFELICNEVVLKNYKLFENKNYNEYSDYYKKLLRKNIKNKQDVLKLDIYKKRILSYDKNRINTISEQIIKTYKDKEKILVLTNFVEEIDIYYKKLKSKIKNLFLLYSQKNNLEYKNFIENYDNENYVVIGTKDYLGTGIDITSLTVLHFTNLFKNTKLILQCLGRISRNNESKIHKFYYYNISSKNLNITNYIKEIRKAIAFKNYKIYILEV